MEKLSYYADHIFPLDLRNIWLALPEGENWRAASWPSWAGMITWVSVWGSWICHDDQHHEEEMGDDRDHDLLMIIRRIMIRFVGIFAFPFEDSPSNTLLQGRLSNSGRWMTALYKCNLSKIHDSFVAFIADFTTRSWNLRKCKRLSVRWSNSLI